MGTYGRGEIAELVAWLRPQVSAITAIGPVHLERFGTEDEIVRAKSEIFAGAGTAVLNVDNERLKTLAEQLTGISVVRCSARDPLWGCRTPRPLPTIGLSVWSPRCTPGETFNIAQKALDCEQRQQAATLVTHQGGAFTGGIYP